LEDNIMTVRCTLCRGTIGFWDDAELYGFTDDGREVAVHSECDVDVLAIVGDRAPFGVLTA
jgi:hypothetical protein